MAAPETESARGVPPAVSWTPPEDGLPPIVDAADFAAKLLIEPPQLVKGILHKGSKLVLGGGSKTFKTWTLLDLALSVAHGLPWLGFETARGKVLYLNFEIQNFAWQKRIKAVTKAKKITLQRGAIELWNLRGQAAGFETLLPKIVARIKDAGFALVILDPIYKLYGGADENSAQAIAAVLNGVENVAVETGAAIAFGAHYSKGNEAGKEAIDRISGSGVFARDPDAILNFTRHKTNDAFVVESTLRNFPPIPAFVARFNFPLFERDAALNPADLKMPAKGGRDKVHTVETILECLAGQKLTSTEWKTKAIEAGIGKSSFHTLLREAKTKGQVIQNAKGQYLVAGINQKIVKVQLVQ